VYLLVFYAHINVMHGSRSKIPSKNLVHIYIYDIKFLALLGAPYIYDISRLRVNHGPRTPLSCTHETSNTPTRNWTNIVYIIKQYFLNVNDNIIIAVVKMAQ
jgi:hypothetical protein